MYGIIRGMEIAYLGHSCFKVKTKSGVVVTDPYGKIGTMKLPALSADLVTVSHAHADHNNIDAVAGTARREKPFVITQPGEYEVEGISVFGYPTFHDNKEGAERGGNTIYIIQAEGLRLLHLGDLGHPLSEKLLDELDTVDLVMVPTGGYYTMDGKVASDVVASLEPSYVLPMHYRTPQHDEKTFGEVTGVEPFVTAYGHGSRTVKTLSISPLSLPVDSTEVILFEGFVSPAQ